MIRLTTVLFVQLVIAWHAASAAEPTREQVVFFENNVRPLLAQQCHKCHGPKKQESGLRLDARAGALKGGENGPAIIPGRPGQSLFVKAIRYEGDLEMPPKRKLDPAQIAMIVKWIEMGAPWPDDRPVVKVRGGGITDAERRFWSFQPIVDRKPPQIEGPQINNDIDRFVMARLRSAKLEPTAPATKRTLIRRATFDLTGLAPTPADIQSFLADDSPDAFAKVVDRLLASTAYGERWGRHWLDVVRYADTAGETADYPTPHSYKYRNWVIDALNDDKPYDEFIREQIAGDILAQQDPNLSDAQFGKMFTATGFIAISRRFGFDVENYHHLTIQDTIDTLGQAVLGLSLGCARCHDHKYDPVNTADYYAWYGIFESTRYSFPGSEQKKRPYDLFPALPPKVAAARKAAFDSELAKTEAEIKSLEQEQKDLSARLSLLGRGSLGFELQPLGKPPSAPWGSHESAYVVQSAQSPYTNVLTKGTRGIAFPRSNENTHFGRKIMPPRKAADTPKLYFNIDFRNTGQASGTGGSYRFYLGRGPGHSAAVELAASATNFFAKNGATYQPVRELKMGQWYNLQLAVDLRAKTYSGTIGQPGNVTAFEGKAFTTGWDGTIDQFFVDRYGHLPGITPAREFDNVAIGTSPNLPVDRTAGESAPVASTNSWRPYLQGRLLSNAVANADGHQGFLVWRAKGNDLPIVGVNVTAATLTVPGTVPPKALVAHPLPKDGVGVAWRSPIAGRVRISGKVADAHDCGDSVSWHLDLLGREGFANLASGDNQRNGQSEFAAAATAGEKLKAVEVQAGDFIQLALLPKVNHGCDLTRIELQIHEVDGNRSWDVTPDVMGNFHAGNPHADRLGNEATWFFYQVEPDRGAGWAGSILAGGATINVAEARDRSEKITDRLSQLRPRRDELKKTGPYDVVYGATEKDEAKDAQIRIRGERNKLGDQVPRKNLEILGNDSLPPDAGSGRRQLAEWMTRAENPLMARVMVNRIWQHHFGRGLVGTENDFGTRGERPTHPELLDWLASRFKESSDSIKAMHRLMMASAAYQRSSDFDVAAAEVDPDSRLLWRFNRRRLSAEEIRDAMLLVSGELDATMGGEHPFPAVNTWGFTQHAPYYGVYPTKRRSIYMMQQRLKRHPFLALFDGADPNVSTARRELTTVPTQALYLMNNEFVHARAAGLAGRVMSAASDQQARIEHAYQIAFGRPPRPHEQAEASQFLKRYGDALAENKTPENDRALAAWSGLARTLLTRNEFLFVD